MSEPETPAIEPSAPAAATQDLMASFVPPANVNVSSDGTPVMANTPNTGEFDWLNPDASDKPPEAQPAIQPGQPAATPKPASQPAATEPSWTPESILDKVVGNPEDFIKGDAKITQFKELRGLAGEAMKRNQALELELAQVRSAGAGNLDGKPMPETEAIAALKAKLASQEADVKSWQEQKARNDLASNPAFLRQHDAPRAHILRELGATASEVDLQEGDVQDFLRLDSEFKQQKWIDENVEDETAAGLFKEKGASFLGLTNDKSSSLQSADPLAELDHWNEYEDAFGNQMAVKLDEGIARQFQAAATRVIGEINSDGNDRYFETATGKAEMAEIQRRFAEGQGVSPEQTIKGLLSQGKADAYEALAVSMSERLVKAEQENARLRGLDPGARMYAGTSSPSPPQPSGGADDGVDIFGGSSGQGFAGGITPLVSSEQLAAAMNNRGAI